VHIEMVGNKSLINPSIVSIRERIAGMTAQEILAEAKRATEEPGAAKIEITSGK